MSILSLAQYDDAPMILFKQKPREGFLFLAKVPEHRLKATKVSHPDNASPMICLMKGQITGELSQ